ncbi:MAG: hypothetical protein P4L51_04790 [Puia sp.]|nr:hypothetical protein [Puia sp.]
MNTKSEQEMEDRLWEYIDGAGDAAWRMETAGLLEALPEWREKYSELMELHQAIGETELDAPSMRFTKNVMEEIAKYQVAPATKNYINKNIIRGIGGVFVAMILGALVYVFTRVSWKPENGGGQPSGNLFKNLGLANFDAGSFGWAQILNNTYVDIFLLINTVLGLMLLDMYLTGKKQAHTGHPFPEEKGKS